MTDLADLGFVHRFVPAIQADRPPLMLLHGTGGDEHDLIDLGRAVSPGSALLSPRGRVLEGGMPRFFRRLAEGVFDEADVIRRAHELADFVVAAREEYGLPPPVALGFSNGANIAAALLLLRPEVLAGAMLMRPMMPLTEPPPGQISGTPVLVVSGQSDPIVPRSNVERLVEALRRRGAAVDAYVLPAGHGLSQADVTLAAGWMARSSTSLAA